MKALLLTNLFPSQAEPTRGVFNLNRFGALSRHCETRVVVPVRWWSRLRQPTTLLNVPEEEHGGMHAYYPAHFAIPSVPRSHVPGMHAACRALATRLRAEFPFDVILAAMAYPEGVVAARLADDFGCPLVTMVLGSDINELAERPELRESIRHGLRRASRVVAVSHALRDRMVTLGVDAERIRVQHNGVDGERFQPRPAAECRARLKLPTDRRLVTYVGNLNPEKGAAVLVEALGKLHAAGRLDFDLALVGGGPLEAKLRTRAEALGITEHVRLVGRRPHAEIPDWIGAGDALCLPSFREGCPNVVLEALAAGRPVAASEVGGVPELLNADNGRLAPAGDADALADALRGVLDRSWDPTALRATVQFLSWEQYGLTLRDVLTEAHATWHGEVPSESAHAGKSAGGVAAARGQ
jgi:glycosyltransferase involved in cell wall biosynthesis